MPFWYACNLLLLIAEWVPLRRTAGVPLLAAAVGSWVVVILFTLVFLVPINNRLAREEAHASAEQAHREHKRWDSLHRARVIALIVAMVLFLVAIHV
jgi:uncharacterized membrane protein